jgi:hypothetical protein
LTARASSEDDAEYRTELDLKGRKDPDRPSPARSVKNLSREDAKTRRKKRRGDHDSRVGRF